MQTRSIRLLMIVGAFVAGFALFSAVVLLVSGRPGNPLIATASSVGGPFNLTDQNGRAVSETDIKGKPSLVFFGFTHCPDICPTALFEVSEILRVLGKDGDRVNALFVSVDPERDTPAKLKDYLSSFDPRLRALTGTPESVAVMEKNYRVYSKKVPLTGGDYTMDHTAIVYLMDKDGRFVAPFNLKRTPDLAAGDLKRYL